MENLTPNSSGNLKLVDPLQLTATVHPEPPERLGPRVLELMGVLQTTLDLDQQIELFARESRRSVFFDGLLYRHEQRGIEITVDEQAENRCTYELEVEGELLGEIRFNRNHPFTERELSFLENLLCGLVYPLRNALNYRMAIQSAFRDPLTGAQNRAAMVPAMQREINLARRQNSHLSVLVLDVDHFKRINDTYGHSFGDDVLKTIAHTAGDTIRRSDMLFRFGGEEFLILLSHTDLDGARLLAERIRQAIDAHDVIGGQRIDITASLGVTQLTADDDEKTLFDRADRALYKAKNSGRNQVISL